MVFGVLGFVLGSAHVSTYKRWSGTRAHVSKKIRGVQKFRRVFECDGQNGFATRQPMGFVANHYRSVHAVSPDNHAMWLKNAKLRGGRRVSRVHGGKQIIKYSPVRGVSPHAIAVRTGLMLIWRCTQDKTICIHPVRTPAHP